MAHPPIGRTVNNIQYLDTDQFSPAVLNMVQENDSLFGETIYSYSRAQAIQDGVLVDLSQFPITKQQWKMHFACTDTVWNIIDAAVKHGKDRDGVLHDIYTMARLTLRGKKELTSVLNFRVLICHTVHSMKLICGPGDTLEPVLTLMLPSED